MIYIELLLVAVVLGGWVLWLNHRLEKAESFISEMKNKERP